jgi:NADH-quinone oxidoreductase subunit F
MDVSCQVDLSQVDTILERYPLDESSLVMVLQDVQSTFNFLPCEALERVAHRLAVPRSRVFSVATFYKVFSLEPQGRTVIQVCKGTACHVRGAQLVEDELCRQLGVAVGETTEDQGFTIRTVNCVGACAMAPVVIVGDTYHGEVPPARVGRMLKRAERQDAPARERKTTQPPIVCPARFDSPAELVARGDELAARREALATEVLVCGGPGCLAAGAREVHARLAEAAKSRGLDLEPKLERCSERRGLLALTGCQGLCQQGPLVQIHAPGALSDVLYTGVKPAHAEAIVEALQEGRVLEERLGEARGRDGHPFYRSQDLRALATCGRVDPESLDDYLAVGGFRALARALTESSPPGTPETSPPWQRGDGSANWVLDAVKRSGVRGRGGAGFHTARKWQTALRAAADQGKPPYVLCNGDEGDPGAFMDRAIMEGAPYQVIEGMVLGAFALGAREGYIYVRAEYPLAVERLQLAIETCRAAGLLGEGILGRRGFDYDLRISRGGGAFVCGESTALMRSIEGKVGEPRAKYVRSAERGLRDSPTVLQNVETWALIPGIVRNGPESFAAVGTERSRGTKAFSLTGQVQRTGLVEVPMGTTLRELIFDIGGGVPPGRRFKAVQTGGPSGGCLPESQLDLPVDFDALTEAGSMMGSGGMIVMDDRTCMVDVARYFVDFLLEESCGKCTACRLGLPQLSHLLDRVVRGQGTAADLAAIEDVCATMTVSSLCGLGKSAPNPVLSTLKYFRHEYEAHLEGRCPAGVCRELIRYTISDACTGCLLCIKPCPTQAITGEKKELHVIDQDLCTRCGICRSICEYDAVDVTSGGQK